MIARTIAIPREKSLDSTLALLADGYMFISKRCERLQSDVFETRLMLRKAICAMGEDAAAMFYHPDRFTRKHAIPATTLMLLQGLGSMQLLDGPAHRRRKQMHLSLMTADRIRQLTAIFEKQWQSRIPKWIGLNEVVLHYEVEQLLCSTVCQWAGVPLTEAAVRQRAREFGAMIEGAGAVGPRNWKGLVLRSRTESWARSIIDGVRANHFDMPEGSAAQAVALYRDMSGELLDTRLAAVELINVLRPTVAVARYVTFAALALHQYPKCRQIIQSGDKAYLEWFVQEVRRFYPFFPAVGGRVLKEFDWRGIHFAKGTWLLLDLYGTNHDARIWGDPQEFRPERFRDWNGSPFNFIPQGGGDFVHGHRCPGEWITIELVKTALRLLVSGMDYDVPAQDLRISLSRMPAIPKSRFVISNVRRSSLDGTPHDRGALSEPPQFRPSPSLVDRVIFREL
jgi:fatty-acid peroxygenase